MPANNFRMVVVSSDPDFIAEQLPLVGGQEILANNVNADPAGFADTVVDLGDLICITDAQKAFLQRESIDVVMYWEILPAEEVVTIDAAVDLAAWARKTFSISKNVQLRAHLIPASSRIVPVITPTVSVETLEEILSWKS